MSNSNSGWIGVDLDGTLAHYEGWNGANHIGEPLAPMLERHAAITEKHDASSPATGAKKEKI